MSLCLARTANYWEFRVILLLISKFLVVLRRIWEFYVAGLRPVCHVYSMMILQMTGLTHTRAHWSIPPTSIPAQIYPPTHTCQRPPTNPHPSKTALSSDNDPNKPTLALAQRSGGREVGEIEYPNIHTQVHTREASPLPQPPPAPPAS